MKTTLLSVLIQFLIVSALTAQSLSVLPYPNSRVNAPAGHEPSKCYGGPGPQLSGQCISDDDISNIRRELDANKAMLRKKNPQYGSKKSSVPPSFIWPVQAKAGFTDYGFYTVQFQVDHNLAWINQLQDYNCGTRTYDWSGGNHQGTDIILWPYPWRRMDEQVMEIVAAAPGVIINKVDGNFDRNCANTGGTNWNSIYVEHDDGSEAWYLHFKSGSLTPKVVGDSVVAGEYLGNAGSSGSSDWPHLHFQVYDQFFGLIDPFQGSCNSLNNDSWWQNQQPYMIPKINRICTKSTMADYYVCPNPEITYEKDTFATGDSLILKLFYRDINTGDTTTLRLLGPSGQFLEWDWVSTWPFYPTSQASWYYILDPWFVQGNWMFEVDFGGTTYSHPFVISGVAGQPEEILSNLLVSPNPSNGSFTLSYQGKSAAEARLEITDISGKVVYSNNYNSVNGLNQIDITDFKANEGVYFCRMWSGNLPISSVEKIIIRN